MYGVWFGYCVTLLYKNTAHLGVDLTEILLLLTSLIFIIYYAKWTWVRKLTVLLYYCEIISRGFYIYFIDIATLLSSGRKENIPEWNCSLRSKKKKKRMHEYRYANIEHAH